MRPHGWPLRRGVVRGSYLFCGLATLISAACSGPDRDTLYRPLENGRVSGPAAVGGSQQQEQPLPLPSGMGGTPGEGNPPVGLSGAGGTSNVITGPVGTEDPDAGSTDPSVPDAAVHVDAGPPPPPPCEPSDEVCDGLDNNCDDIVDNGQTCAANCFGFVLDEHGYMFCLPAVNRTTALERCAVERMRLAWIETEGENVALVGAITQRLDGEDPTGLLTQIGATDATGEGNWRWVGNRVAPDGPLFWQGGPAAMGGEAVGNAFVNWDDTEPNNSPNEDCAAISIFGSPGRVPGEWDDRNCANNANFPFVCEAP
jgi:hypothetical protein